MGTNSIQIIQLIHNINIKSKSSISKSPKTNKLATHSGEKPHCAPTILYLYMYKLQQSTCIAVKDNKIADTKLIILHIRTHAATCKHMWTHVHTYTHIYT